SRRRADATDASAPTVWGNREDRAPVRSAGERVERGVERELVPLTRGALLALDHAASDALRTDRDLHRHAEQVGVGELHARAGVAVVEEDVDAARAQTVVE